MKPVIFLLLAGLLPAQTAAILEGRLVRRDTPGASTAGVTVRLVTTRQTTVTTTSGYFKFVLPPAFSPGSELQIELQHPVLRLLQPHNGYLVLPRPGSRLTECQVVPKSSALLLGPESIEALLNQAARQAAPPPPPLAGQAAPSKEPPLRRYLKDWAGEYGFSLEAVEQEVKKWADEVRAKRDKYSERQQALAELQNRNYPEAQRLFEASAASELTEFERLAAEAKRVEERTVAALNRYVEDRLAAANSAASALKLEDAVRILSETARHVPKARYPNQWAGVVGKLGETYTSLGNYGDPKKSLANYQEAVARLREAQGVHRRDSHLTDWVTWQSGIADAYSGIADHLSGPEGLKQHTLAVEALTQAVEALDQENEDLRVLLRAALANTYVRRALRLPQAERAAEIEKALENIQPAIASKQGHLQEIAQIVLSTAFVGLAADIEGAKRSDFLLSAIKLLRELGEKTDPTMRSLAQSDIGNAYLLLADVSTVDEEKGDFLRHGVQAFEEALRFHSREKSPQGWARLTGLRAVARAKLAFLMEPATIKAELESARVSLTQALEVCSREEMPLVWVNLSDYLGGVLGALGQQATGPEARSLLEQSVRARRAAASASSAESNPTDHVRMLTNLAISLDGLAEHADTVEEAAKVYQEAVDTRKRALDSISQESRPTLWSQQWTLIGITHENLARKLQGTSAMERLGMAEEAYRKTLAVRSEETTPAAWAETQANLGDVYFLWAAEIEGESPFLDKVRQGIQAFEVALRHRTKEQDPGSWAKANVRLGALHSELGKRAQGAAGESHWRRSIQCFENALLVYARSSEPNLWTSTTTHLADAQAQFGTRLSGEPGRALHRQASVHYQELLEHDAKNLAVLAQLASLHADHLWEFEKAFEYNRRREALGDPGFDFTENHFTTARFAECAKRAEGHLQNLKDEHRKFTPILHLYRTTSLAALNQATGADWDNLAANLPADRTGWNVEGARHFVDTHPAFAAKREAWKQLFTAIDAADASAARTAIATLRRP